MPFAINQSTSIHFQTLGHGEPLVLIMGLGGDITSWKQQTDTLSKEFKLILIDNRGVGLSDKPEDSSRYNMQLMASDVAAVLDELGIEKTHMLGVSMGGLIAQEFYHLYPQRVSSMILACSGVGPNDDAYVFPEQVVLDTLALADSDIPATELSKKLAGIFYHPKFIRAIPDFFDRVAKAQQALDQPSHAIASQLKACWTHTPNSPRLHKIEVPVLVLHGDEDQVWKVTNAQYLANHIPRAILFVLKQAGHMLMIEKSNDFNHIVLDFLRENASENANPWVNIA